jgi:hypothetical protein
MAKAKAPYPCLANHFRETVLLNHQLYSIWLGHSAFDFRLAHCTEETMVLAFFCLFIYCINDFMITVFLFKKKTLALYTIQNKHVYIYTLFYLFVFSFVCYLLEQMFIIS